MIFSTANRSEVSGCSALHPCAIVCLQPRGSSVSSRYLGSVQVSRSVVSDSATPWTAARQASLSITNPWSLLRLMSTESVMPSNHLILCRPLLLLPSVFPRSGSFQMSQLFASGSFSFCCGVLRPRILKWFAIALSSGTQCSVGVITQRMLEGSLTRATLSIAVTACQLAQGTGSKAAGLGSKCP